MRDGSDAIADWPLLNAMLNVASGAAWVALHHGGGVGIGRSIHAGAQVVADGTDDGALRVERVLTNDPGTGVMRHADAGYDEALEHARATGPRPARDHDVTVTLVPDLVLDADRRAPRSRASRSSRRRHDRRACIGAADAPADAVRLTRTALAPGFVNVALARFQRDAARAASSACRTWRPRTTSGRGARRCTRPPARSTPTASATSRGAASADARRRLHGGGRVPLRPPPARRHAVRAARTRCRGGLRGRRGRRDPHRAAAHRLRARRLRSSARSRPAPLLRPHRRGLPGPARGAAAVGRTTGRWSRSATPRTPCAPSPRRWLSRHRRALRRPRPRAAPARRRAAAGDRRDARRAPACARSS